MGTTTVAHLSAIFSLNNTKFKKGVNESKGMLSGFQKSVLAIGPSIAAAFSIGAIKNFTKNALESYNIQAQAENQLLVALKGRKNAQELLIEQARELQKITLFGDEETIRAQALIAAFVKEEKQIKRVIPLVQDLATAKKMDLAGAADLVSKTLGSSTNALSRYGIEVSGAVGSVERLESLMIGLNKAFGGQAEAAAKVGTGPMVQFKNVVGDLTEQVGESIIILTDLNTTIQTLTSTLSKLDIAGKVKDYKIWRDEHIELDKVMRSLLSPARALIEYTKLQIGLIDKLSKKRKKAAEEIEYYTSVVKSDTTGLELAGKSSFDLGKSIDKTTASIDNQISSMLSHEEELGAVVPLNGEFSSGLELLSHGQYNLSDSIEKTNNALVSQIGFFNDSDKVIDSSVDKIKALDVAFKKTGEQIKKVSFELASTFTSSIGYALGMGEPLKKMLADLSSQLLMALGDILISVGLMMGPPVGIGFILAGLASKFGGSFIQGLSNRKAMDVGESVVNTTDYGVNNDLIYGTPVTSGYTTLNTSGQWNQGLTIRGNDLVSINQYSQKAAERLG